MISTVIQTGSRTHLKHKSENGGQIFQNWGQKSAMANPDIEAWITHCNVGVVNLTFCLDMDQQHASWY